MNISKEVKLASTNRKAATPMALSRKHSLAAGIFYLLTFVSIPTVVLYSLIHDPNYIIGAGPDTAAVIGGILEIIVALAGIGTAVALFPVLKKQNESFALGFVSARILESGTIFVGVAFILSIVTLRQVGAGADALVTSHTLSALYDRIFLLGQSFMPAICDLLLGILLYQSRLVPRALSVMESSERLSSSLVTSPYYSVSSADLPPWQRYPHFRSHYLSFRWASGLL
jgi:hypothetical protein